MTFPFRNSYSNYLTFQLHKPICHGRLHNRTRAPNFCLHGFTISSGSEYPLQAASLYLFHYAAGVAQPAPASLCYRCCCQKQLNVE